ncbi:MAG: deoxynucleoside kinase [Pseudomonadota bacterium]
MSTTAFADLRNLDLADRLNDEKRPGFIVVEGPIGVGKTTLCQRLARTLGYGSLLERPADNPFLDAFYRDQQGNALATQLFFLLQRAQQLAPLNGQALLGLQIVSDFMLEKDDLFAQLNLATHEYELYRQIHQSLRVESPTPDLVIYLQAPTRVLLQRVRQRGIAAEQRMEAAYLDALTAAYTEFFHHYNDAPLLIVNAAEIDLASNQQHYEALLERAFSMAGTRQFYNPHPSLL